MVCFICCGKFTRQSKNIHKKSQKHIKAELAMQYGSRTTEGIPKDYEVVIEDNLEEYKKYACDYVIKSKLYIPRKYDNKKVWKESIRQELEIIQCCDSMHEVYMQIR